MEGCVGTLIVKVIAAYDLKNQEGMLLGAMGNKSDPYCVVRVGDREAKTEVINSNLNPVWDAPEMEFGILPGDETVEFEVMDSDTGSKDDKMGNILIALNQLQPGVNMACREKLSIGEAEL